MGPDGPSARPVYANYHPVFFGFYSFLHALRSTVVFEVERPYEHVLSRLEECLDYTERLQGWEASPRHAFCRMSHRRYAEVLFFLKAYLRTACKPVASGLRDRPSSPFPTHTRLFLLFADDHAPFGTTLRRACEAEDGRDESICVSWRVYRGVVDYLHSTADLSSALGELLRKTTGLESPAVKVSVLNGLEAAYLNHQRSNMIDWAKANALLAAPDARTGLSLLAQLKFGPSDSPVLANYLKRTYAKLTLDPHEVQLSRVVQQALNGPPDEDPQRDSLARFLFFADCFVPNYLKLFLQFANADRQFQRLADLLVRFGIAYDLVRLNDIELDDFYLQTARTVQALDDQGALRHVEAKLAEKYEEILQKSRAITSNIVLQNASDSDEFDMLDYLLNEDKGEEKGKSR